MYIRYLWYKSFLSKFCHVTLCTVQSYRSIKLYLGIFHLLYISSVNELLLSWGCGRTSAHTHSLFVTNLCIIRPVFLVKPSFSLLNLLWSIFVYTFIFFINQFQISQDKTCQSAHIFVMFIYFLHSPAAETWDTRLFYDCRCFYETSGGWISIY